jgi:hypothetical protein
MKIHELGVKDYRTVNEVLRPYGLSMSDNSTVVVRFRNGLFQ